MGFGRLAASKTVLQLFAGSRPSPESGLAFDLGRGAFGELPASDSPDIACRAAGDSSAVVPGTVAAAGRGIAGLVEDTFLAAGLAVRASAGTERAAVAFQAEVAGLAETAAVRGSRLAADIQDGSASAIALNFVLASEAFLGIAAVALVQVDQAWAAFQGTAAAD